MCYYINETEVLNKPINHGHTTVLHLKMSIFPRPQREKVESELAFLGLLIMENRLKNETRPVLQELSEARIRTVMVTGMCASRAQQVTRRSGKCVTEEGGPVTLQHSRAGTTFSEAATVSSLPRTTYSIQDRASRNIRT